MIRTYAVVLSLRVTSDSEEKEECLATNSGSILVGTQEQLKYLFTHMVISFVPISNKSTVPLMFVDSPEYAGGTIFGVPGAGFERWKEEHASET